MEMEMEMALAWSVESRVLLNGYSRDQRLMSRRQHLQARVPEIGVPLDRPLLFAAVIALKTGKAQVSIGLLDSLHTEIPRALG